MALANELATPERKRRYVRGLFARIAPRYDLITVLLSLGRDREWKRRLVDLAGPREGVRALDLATGTGDIALRLAARGARVVALDITPQMIALARAKPGRRAIQFLTGDMIALPLPGAAFDIVTVGYGLRNVPDLGLAIDELFRVMRAGGCLVSLDFNRPSNPVVRALYLSYLTAVGGALGWALHRDPDTYRYIAASLRAYPGADGISRLLERRGFVRVVHYPMLGGLMSIHRAFKGS
jgi:demethylmenaquinone methyltransferase/2-methoxy-6-polyprenyl-1,4-benzoquinol methylase